MMTQNLIYDSQHYSFSNPGNFQALLNFRVDSGDTKLEAF